MEQWIETKNIGRKFNPDGSVRFFPGNTVISKLHEDSEIYPLISRISRSFREVQGRKYAYLPEHSFHMTVIQGVCDEDRKAELWSRHLSLETPLEETDVFFEQQFSRAKPLGQVKMVFDRVDTERDIIIVRFRPAAETDRRRMEEYRSELSELLGIRFPDHDSYGFHVSVAYKLWKLEPEEETAVEQVRDQWNKTRSVSRPSFFLPQPELTFFENMFEFRSRRFKR